MITPSLPYSNISIHAPREGGDRRQSGLSGVGSHFNPRPPRGGRLQLSPDGTAIRLFQSTPPARGATPRPATSAAAR